MKNKNMKKQDEYICDYCINATLDLNIDVKQFQYVNKLNIKQLKHLIS
jgi:hypothetical protein